MAAKSKKVRDLKPGDRVPVVRVVIETRHTDSTTTIVFDDGMSQAFDIVGDPAIPVEE